MSIDWVYLESSLKSKVLKTFLNLFVFSVIALVSNQ